MNACNLCKDILSHNRFIGRNHNTGIGLYHPTDIIQAAFVNIGHCIEMIFQNSLHTGKGCITGPFAKSVNRSMQSSDTAQHGSQHITYRQIIIIMRVKIKMGIRITLLHLPHIFYHLQRVQDSQCIGQHITSDACLLQAIHQLKHIFGRIFHSVTPVFQIYIHSDILFICVMYYVDNICDMFFGSLFQLLGAMFQ